MDLLNSYTRKDLTQADKALEVKHKLALLTELRQNKEILRKEVAFLSIREKGHFN